MATKLEASLAHCNIWNFKEVGNIMRGFIYNHDGYSYFIDAIR